MTIEDYIFQRNELQIAAENINKETADRCWAELGVANRHIARVLNGETNLRFVENELYMCLRRVQKQFNITVSGGENVELR